MPRPHREFELKLDLSGKDLDRLSGNPKLRSRKKAVREILKSVYYDTPTYKLHAEGLSLRVREDKGGHIQTVKLAKGPLGEGISNPIEIEDRLDAPEPDLGRISDKRVRRKVQKAAKGSALTKAFETVVTRTTHRFQARGSVMELALDRGEAVAMNRRSEICEAELELVKGQPKDMLRTAQNLFAQSNVRPASASKAEKGYRLLKGPSSRAIEPVRAEPPNLAKDSSCGEAFAEIFRKAREQIVKNRTVLLETEEPEGAHQLRVGLTRLRSAQRVLKAFANSPQLRKLEIDAQTLARAVGQLRDADVLIEHIFAPIAGNPPRQPGFDTLYRALLAHRFAMQKEARRALCSEAWSRLLLSLALWPDMLEREPSLRKPVKRFADEALQKRWKKAAKLGRHITSLQGEERHKMRKTLKKLRYTAQFVAPLYPNGRVRPYIKRLKKLQDVFGYVNDVAMAAKLGEISSERSEGQAAPLLAAGKVLGHHEAEASRVWETAPKAWRKLKTSRRFWR